MGGPAPQLIFGGGGGPSTHANLGEDTKDVLMQPLIPPFNRHKPRNTGEEIVKPAATTGFWKRSSEKRDTIPLSNNSVFIMETFCTK